MSRSPAPLRMQPQEEPLPLETPGVTRQVFVAGGVEILIEVFEDGRVRVNGDEVEVVGKDAVNSTFSKAPKP